MQKNIILLGSAGINSATAALLFADKIHSVINFGMDKKDIEYEYAKNLYDNVIKIPLKQIVINTWFFIDENIPYPPVLLGLFISTVASIAYFEGCDTIMLPIHKKINPNLPGYTIRDARILNKYLNTITNGKVRLATPFINIQKYQIMILGRYHGFDYKLTQSCYKNVSPPCGLCPSCQLRMLSEMKSNNVIKRIGLQQAYDKAVKKVDLKNID